MASSTSKKSPSIEPVSVLHTVHILEPSLSDNRSPESRLRDALRGLLGLGEDGVVRLPLGPMRDLANSVFAGGRDLDCITLFDGQCHRVAGIGKAGSLHSPVGLAVDLGSTTIVLYLVDLATGSELSKRSYENPQRGHGEDILSRILYASRGKGLEELREQTLSTINRGIRELVQGAGLTTGDVYFATVAGNTTMVHFFLGLDPSHICKEPYIPVANRFDILAPSDVGMEINPLGCCYVFPNVGSYFGGDLLAGILASGMHRREEISMLIDVGTNAEVVLGNSMWMVACAGAAGPALEGGILKCGMRATKGAIDRVKIDPSSLEVTYKTIGGGRPLGMCGSGIIDLLAEMFVAGIVDPTGKLQVDRVPHRIKAIGGEAAFIVAHEGESATDGPIYISQSDIKNLIRSKGAMYTILNVVIESVGISFDDIERFYVAGAFGNYIDPEKAVTIGMLPDVPLGKFVGLGNAAGLGAKALLLDRRCMAEVDDIMKKITYLEMNVRGDFMGKLTGALFLPHTDKWRFPNVMARLGGKRAV